MGSDLTVVNAARVSFDKRSYEMNAKDERLLRFLITNGHTSPLRHAVLQYEVYMPLLVARQWNKYRVGCTWLFEDSDDPIETWNESSRRYVTEEPVFYNPGYEEWRRAPENKKQGSGETFGKDFGKSMHWEMSSAYEKALSLYTVMLEDGVCAEQARLVLPAYAMYVRAWWTVSLQGVLHFLHERLKDTAQFETRVCAEAVRSLTEPLFPQTFAAFGLASTEAH